MNPIDIDRLDSKLVDVGVVNVNEAERIADASARPSAVVIPFRAKAKTENGTVGAVVLLALFAGLVWASAR